MMDALAAIDPLLGSMVLIAVLALLGQSVGVSMLVGTIAYLFLKGKDVSLAGETILQGLFGSYTLLAIPLFILAADIMNIGSLADKLLAFCKALVGRFRGGLGHSARMPDPGEHVRRGRPVSARGRRSAGQPGRPGR